MTNECPAWIDTENFIDCLKDSGTSKELGVPIITEDEFMEKFRAGE